MKQEIRETIIDAAECLLARYGYHKMTMNDLAEEAGIGVGTTYLYFSGKADVVLAVLERLNIHIQEQLNVIARAPGTPKQRLRRMLIARIMLRYEGVHERRQNLQIEEFRNDVKKAVAERRAHWLQTETQIFAKVLKEGRELQAFDFDDALPTAETLISVTRSLMPRFLNEADFDQPQRMQEKTERVADLLVRGLQSRKSQE